MRFLVKWIKNANNGGNKNHSSKKLHSFVVHTVWTIQYGLFFVGNFTGSGQEMTGAGVIAKPHRMKSRSTMVLSALISTWSKIDKIGRNC